MKIQFQKKNTTLMVRLIGEIDHHCAEDIRKKVEGQLEQINGKNIVFIFEEVTFMDSSGIGMVLGRYKKTKSLGGATVMCGAKQKVLEVFRLSGMLQIIPCYKNLEDALKTMEGEGRA